MNTATQASGGGGFVADMQKALGEGVAKEGEVGGGGGIRTVAVSRPVVVEIL